MQKQGLAVGHAEIKSVGIKSIKRANPEPVYNMEVEDNHNFAVADGLIVHNCMDAMRYFVRTKHLIRRTLRRDLGHKNPNLPNFLGGVNYENL